jgi:PAS domain S-box-containing protein
MNSSSIACTTTPLGTLAAALINADGEVALALIRRTAAELIVSRAMKRICWFDVHGPNQTLRLRIDASASDAPVLHAPEQLLSLPPEGVLLSANPVTLLPSGGWEPWLGGGAEAVLVARLFRGHYVLCFAQGASDVDHFLELAEIGCRALNRQQLYEELESERHQMNALMDTLPDAIYFKDVSSRFIRASRRVAELNGLRDPKDLLGRTDHDLFTAEHADEALRDEQDVMRTGEALIAKEEKETWPDGRITWTLSTKLPFRDDSGNIIGTFGISRDVTQLRETRMELLASRELLAQRYAAMQSDLAQARVIQAALLPQAPPVHPAIRVRFRYEPLEAIGGDFFSFTDLPGGGLATFLGDLTGHGVSAALFMSLVRCTTDQVIAAEGAAPARTIQSLDRILKNQIPHGFITAIYAVLVPQADGSALLHWCGAGHPEAVLVANGTAEFLPGGDGAIGIFDFLPREQQSRQLRPGDRLYLYTDGIPEMRRCDGSYLGNALLAEMLLACHRPDLDETLDQFMEALRKFRGSAASEDDVALIALEVGG